MSRLAEAVGNACASLADGAATIRRIARHKKLTPAERTWLRHVANSIAYVGRELDASWEN